MEFFRHCPGCGKRFHIKLESKKMVHLERKTIRKTETRRSARLPGPSGYGTSGAGFTRQPVVVFEGPPVILDIEEFQYNYKCGHCGHEWSEKKVETHSEK
ncbi:MAG TPA: hypothetical protein VE955_04525 [Candidatus Dormibacteraeota bacterium]|jgi:DNA-directed RNA polymerase subunit RPC12/RpoP|nr:hypothetical protein [Candidatus Dormibacteraeota bacterium]